MSFERIASKTSKKVLKKFLTNEKRSDIINKLLKKRLRTSKSSEKSCFQQIAPCKLNNDVLKILFDMNKVVVRT